MLNPERVQEVGPNGANELPASVGEKSSGGAKVGDDMPHEGLTDCARGVITGGDENSVLREQSTKTIRSSWRRSGGSGPTISIDRVSHGPWD